MSVFHKLGAYRKLRITRKIISAELFAGLGEADDFVRQRWIWQQALKSRLLLRPAFPFPLLVLEIRRA